MSTSVTERPTVNSSKSGRGLASRVCFIAVVILLATSGAVRALQERRLVAAARGATVAPFSLATLPNKLGSWKAMGEDMVIDTKTLQIAGCSDYVTRNYVDEQTGVIVTVLIAYGPAEKIVGHTPAVCYPAVGYEREQEPIERVLKIGDSTARVRSFVFVKPEEGSGERLHVSVAFRHSGRWTPDASESRKRFRHEPGMFKIQVQRRLGKGERCDPENPTDQFVVALLPELNKSILNKQ